MHYKQNLHNLLTICRKAGKLVMGLDPTKEALRFGTAAGVLVAADASDKTRKEATYFSEQSKKPVILIPFTKVEVGLAIGRAVGVLAVCDAGFFRKMQAMAKQAETEAPEV